MRTKVSLTFLLLCLSLLNTAPAHANCSDLPSHDALQAVLRAAIKPTGGPSNGGLDLNMWASLVDRDGKICAVAFSGQTYGDQWPGSRIIAAQKAYTANAFSLNTLAISTANLFTAVQPGNSLFGLQESNPINAYQAYQGRAVDFGTTHDHLVGERIGGINVFGGGLGLYENKVIKGGLGVSGDTSCADHNVAWRVRKGLGLDQLPGGVSPTKDDGIIYDINDGKSKGGFGHPTCGGKEADVASEIHSGSVVDE